jgi:membrane protein
MSVTSARDWQQTARDPPNRTPLWVTGVTVALLAFGFSRSRPSHPAGSIPSGDKREGRVIAAQGGRGRSATTPSEVPARGWKDILLRIWKNIGKDRVIVVAAGVTFYSVLALFPAIAALVALYGLFADPTTITSHLDSIAVLAPGGAVEVIRDQITRVASQGNTTLGLTFVAGLLASLWSANAGIKSLFDALNLVYNESEKRSFIWLNVVSLTFTLLAIVFALIAIGAMVVVPITLNFLGLAGATEMVIKIVRWPALFIVVSLALAFLYRYGPSREKPRWRWITCRRSGALLARRFDSIFLVRGKFRQLQQNLRFSRRHHRIHVLDLAVDHSGVDWRGTQRGNRASNGTGYDHRIAKAHGRARRDYG